MDGVDEAQTPAWARLAEFRVLLDLTAERLFDLQRDFAVLQDEMVRCYALLGALPPNRSRHVRSSHPRISGAIRPRRRRPYRCAG